MGFAKSRLTVDKQRVVRAGRVCGHRLRRRIGKFIGRANNIGIEGEFIFGFAHLLDRPIRRDDNRSRRGILSLLRYNHDGRTKTQCLFKSGI